MRTSQDGVQIPSPRTCCLCFGAGHVIQPPPPSHLSPLETPQLRLLDSIDESLRHAVESVQLSAMAALRAVLQNWFPVGQDGPSERLRTRLVNQPTPSPISLVFRSAKHRSAYCTARCVVVVRCLPTHRAVSRFPIFGSTVCRVRGCDRWVFTNCSTYNVSLLRPRTDYCF